MTVLFGPISLVLTIILCLVVLLYLRTKDKLELANSKLFRYEGISNIEKYQADLERKFEQAQQILPQFQSMADMQEYKTRLSSAITDYERASKEWQERISEQEFRIEKLRNQSEAVEETLAMQSFGFYRPKYGFEDSERYACEIGEIRDEQKYLVKSDEATYCPQDWAVNGSIVKGRKLVKQHAKLMLRAFNGECNAAIGKVKYNNVNNLEARLKRSFDAINKLGESKHLWITQEYLNCKLKELYLVHEHREKVQEEREEQRRIKEEMREEAKAIKEIEKAEKDAEKEEEAKTKALEKARRDLADASESQMDRLKGIVDKLELELEEALDRKAKAIARAQLTRSGHVYILSNIGSFGEGVYKIGMTRRLEPLERVNELGSASVPFRYDVHAMIYSEDAPALENALHKHFDSRRVNLANLRREFFRISLDEIREAVKEHFGEVTFVKHPEAEEYNRTLSIYESQQETLQAVPCCSSH